MTDLISREAAIAAAASCPDSHWGPWVAERIRTLPAVQPKVKPLVWVMDEHGGFFAKGVNRTYSVFRLALDQATWGAIGVPDTSTDSQFVMDRCQADYESCILSALEPAVQPDAAAIKSAAFDIAVLMEVHAATRSTTKAKAEDIERGIRALIDKPGKEVMPDDNDSTHPRSDTAPAGLSAGGGAGWQPIETAPRDGSRFLGYWPSSGRDGDVAVTTWWDAFEGFWESPFESADYGADYGPTRWMPHPPATEGI